MTIRTIIGVSLIIAAATLAVWRFNSNNDVLSSSNSELSSQTPTASPAESPGAGRDSELNIADRRSAESEDNRLQDLVDKYEPPEFDSRVFDNLPALSETWQATYKNLSSAAEAGDPAAQFGLYQSSYRCYRAPKSEAGFEAKKNQLAEPFYDAAGNYVTQSEDIERIINQVRADWEYCSGSNQEKLPEYGDWLERSAANEYLPALLMFGTDYPGDESLDGSNPDDIEIMRERESSYIEKLELAKNKGSIDAVTALANLYLTSNVEHDPSKALSNLYAAAWYKLRYNNSDRLFLTLEQRGVSVPAYEYEEALAAGRDFLKSEECCVTIPNSE